MALCILNADLIRCTKLGASVVPGPRVALLAKQAFCTVSMAVAMHSDLVALALAVDTIAALALEATRTTPSIVQVLIKGSNFTTVSLSTSVSELGVCNSSFSIVSLDALSELFHPSELSIRGCKVARRDHIEL